MWKEELVGSVMSFLNSLILQVEMGDRWVWRLHHSQCYNVNNVYNYFTAVEDNTPLVNKLNFYG